MANFNTVRTYEQFQQDFPQWLINVRNPWELFVQQPGFVVSQTFCVVGALVCLGHALSRGGRWPFLWFGAALSGMMMEMCLYLSPYGETLWFSPTTIDLFGQRVPLFIFFVYPFFYYQAFWAVSKLQLKCRWSEHIAAGMLVVLFDLPFDMVNIKLLHWTLHDTEQMLAERLYSVPWTLLLYFAVTTFTFSYFFHGIRKRLDRRVPLDRWAMGSFRAELCATIGAAVLSLPVGSSLFLAINYPFHTVLGIPNGVVTVGTFVSVLTVVWKFDRKSNRRMPSSQTMVDHMLNLYVVGHFLLCLGLGVTLKPEAAISTGRHQPIGDCEDTQLCLDTLQQINFDFHCIPKHPEVGAYWYTICGTPYENPAEVMFVLSLITFLATLVHWTLHYDFDVRFKIYDFVKTTPTDKSGTKKIR